MSRVRAIVIGVASTAVITASSGLAAAIDLTGTWEGSAQCAVQTHGEPVERGRVPVVLDISQAGTGLNVEFNGLPASGTATDNGVNLTRGFSGFVSCPLLPGIGFGGGGRVDLGPNHATMEGDFTFITVDEVERCRFTVKRTSTVDPGVEGCPD